MEVTDKVRADKVDEVESSIAHMIVEASNTIEYTIRCSRCKWYEMRAYDQKLIQEKWKAHRHMYHNFSPGEASDYGS